MKEDFDKILYMAVQAKDVNYFGKVVRGVATKYGVSVKTVYNRFKSIYSRAPQDVIRAAIMPSKAELESIILNSSSSDEVKSKLGLSGYLFSGIYDAYFGKSTFTKAKEAILLAAPPKVRSSTFREDNVSILMSQHLGDGYYDRERHALKVSHGIKQAEYLRWKVALIHEGYNKVSTKITTHQHAQGHYYVSWYSCRLGNVVFPEDKTEAVPLLTPIGWLLLYLDDGCYGQDMFITTSNKSLADAMQRELKTYGIESHVSICAQGPAHNVQMCGGKNTIGFYKNFIEPFNDIIPISMKYKTEMKI